MASPIPQPLPHPQQQNPHVIEPDDFTDADSAYNGSLGDASYTTSITSSAMAYTYENGRRYHSFHEGEYVLPNDEQEQDRLDLSHHIYRILLKGELHAAPIKNPRRVLDIGTGTGIWAIDFADEHPESEVIGNDLSPIQPSWIPPNCRFEIDDFELPWSYSQPFDYIHGRELEGAIRDHDKLFRQAYENLRPGGWLEMASMDVNSYSDDGTHLKAVNMIEGIKNMHLASKKHGKDMTTAVTWKEKMEKAGFINVREDIYKVLLTSESLAKAILTVLQLPQSPWPKDPKLKELGRYHQVNMFEAVGPYSFALFTRYLGWSRPEIEVLVAGMRKELRDFQTYHLYTKVHIIYGQRPETD
ncbi:hypothetical protein Asppvi_009875 [Aspergillus pseudoviridinutans]|uniref:S-adenosyl-L-methionine-dependent methyltransferase n=1 Tax=Aspergillus pseudoviridinutans TaxID=1517512 RepID=A0A9P3EZJ6_9EURO|nr:uncharacterized protein Asppvi_009875 [Aspergillus pseudoviridinutans]GIJ90910.1 hypothetical protein Asppvi_009875 [Aspergillus pseudoviridinutans]